MMPETERGEPAQLLISFGIGALVGIGLAATWVPERRRRRRRRLPAAVGKRYRRVRRAGGAALDEIQRAGHETVADFREELGASLEAAREEFGDMARGQLDQLLKALRREHRKVRG
jgi:hypothetical protein